jgi:hypothetical protein
VVSIISAPTTANTWGKWEATFDLTTTAIYPHLPYDASAPTGCPGTQGVTVNLRVSNDNWATQLDPIPCTYEDDYTITAGGTGGRTYDQFVPQGTARWHARFAPPSAGTWRWRIESQDADGSITYTHSTDSITVTSAGLPGFTRISADTREIDRVTGEPLALNGIGINLPVDYANPRTGGGALIAHLGANGVQETRLWAASMQMYGGFEPAWRGSWNAGDGNHLQIHNLLNIDTGISFAPYGDAVAALEVYKSSGDSAGIFVYQGLNYGGAPISVEPSSTYRLTLRYLIPWAMTGTSTFGFTAKISQFLANPATDGTPLFTPVNTATGGWVTTTATITTTAGQYHLGGLYLCMHNVTGGSGHTYAHAFIDEAKLEKDLGGGTYGANVLRSPRPGVVRTIDQQACARFNEYVTAAETAGVTLSVTLAHHADMLMGAIRSTDGTWGGTDLNEPAERAANFFGPADGTITPVRWYEKAYARYMQGRWGYSSAIHSWEMDNESDYSTVADAGSHWYIKTIAEHLKSFGNRHLLTASFGWHFMQSSFWANAISNSLDIAQTHSYVPLDRNMTNFAVNHGGTGDITAHMATDWSDTHVAHTRLSDQIGVKQALGTGNLGYNRPVVRGETALTDGVNDGQENDPTKPPSALAALDPNGIWLHKFVMATAFAPSRMHEWLWYYTSQVKPGAGTDLTPIFKRASDALAGIPLNNGNYVDAAATVGGTGGSDLRVVGQKDLTAGRAHLLLDNKTHTHGTVRSGTSPTPVPTTATVSIAGMPVGTYQITFRNPYTGATTTQTVTVT